MKVRIILHEEVREVYEVNYDGKMSEFDPIEHCVESNLMFTKVCNSEYEVDQIK